RGHGRRGISSPARPPRRRRPPQGRSPPHGGLHPPTPSPISSAARAAPSRGDFTPIDGAVHVECDEVDTPEIGRPLLAIDAHERLPSGNQAPPGSNSSSSADSKTPRRMAKSRTVKRRRI